MYEEYYITLPGGFRLPVALVVETCTVYATADADADSDAANAAMTEFALDYLTAQMVAGKVLNCTEEFASEDGFFRLEGTFLCSEMIGRVRQEEIGE